MLNLGMILYTDGVSELFDDVCQDMIPFINRHQKYDWGDVCEEDKLTNDYAVKHGLRVLSSYTYKDEKFWIITEADRSSTTLLLPSEY